MLASNNSLGLVVDSATRVSLGSLPLSLIATFAVPLWTICHIVSLLQLARTAGRVSARLAQRPMPRAISTAISGISASNPSSM